MNPNMRDLSREVTGLRISSMRGLGIWVYSEYPEQNGQIFIGYATAQINEESYVRPNIDTEA